MRRRRSSVAVTAAVVLVAAAAVGAALLGSPGRARPVLRQHVPESVRAQRAFEPGSWWNTPLPMHVPQDQYAVQILHYLRTAPQAGRGCLMVAGVGRHPQWGTPIYWARSTDPAYRVSGVGPGAPAQLAHLRIPRGAVPSVSTDQTMIIYDLSAGYVTALTGARYDPGSDTWTARGATVTYLDSNGLNVKTGRSDNPGNVGTHRGNNAPTMAVSWDQVNAGAVRHVLKVASGPELSDRYVFPMIGSDGGYTGYNPAVPPEGLRLRLQPTIDLAALGLDGQALVIARALQHYGIYLGDSSGTTALKLEDTVAEGRGQLWRLPADALCRLPFAPQYWQVVAPGYSPAG
jgi:hypothetical protein